MKTKEIIKLITADGWQEVRQTGSHRHYRHPDKKGTVTIAVHRMTDDIPKGTENSILKQAGLK